MAAITIRNLDDALKTRLRMRAASRLGYLTPRLAITDVFYFAVGRGKAPYTRVLQIDRIKTGVFTKSGSGTELMRTNNVDATFVALF